MLRLMNIGGQTFLSWTSPFSSSSVPHLTKTNKTINTADYENFTYGRHVNIYIFLHQFSLNLHTIVI